jgi:hypothetical protein
MSDNSDDNDKLLARIIFSVILFSVIVGILIIIYDSCKPYCIKLYKCIYYIKLRLIHRKMATIIPVIQADITDKPIDYIAHEVPIGKVIIL